MASKMPAEVLANFQKDRDKTKAPSGDELTGKAKSDTRKRALAKARKAKQAK